MDGVVPRAIAYLVLLAVCGQCITLQAGAHGNKSSFARHAAFRRVVVGSNGSTCICKTHKAHITNGSEYRCDDGTVGVCADDKVCHSNGSFGKAAIFNICVSVRTPVSPMSDSELFAKLGWEREELMLIESGVSSHAIVTTVLIVVGLILFVLLINFYVARKVKAYWEQRGGQEVYGVKIVIDSCSINPITQMCHIQGLTMHNPDGYNSEYLMKIQDMYVHLNAWTFLTSCFKKVIVDYLHANGLFLVSESHPPYHLSNLQDVQKHEEANHKWHEGREITFHEVTLKEIHLTVITPTPCGPTSFNGKMPDVYHEDFEKSGGGTSNSLGHLTEALFYAAMSSEVAKMAKGRGACCQSSCCMPYRK